MSPSKQRERQPRLIHVTLSEEAHAALRHEIARRGLHGVKGAERVIINEWIMRAAGTVPPLAPSLAPPPAPNAVPEDDDFGFDPSKL